jgi:kynurenine formamidase
MINLTIPLYPYIPTGTIFPWDSPFQTEDIATLEHNAARLFYIYMGSDNGTRLLSPALVHPTGATTKDIPLESLANRRGIVLRIPKDAGEAIQPDEIESALVKGPGLELGDALIIATGWGDNQNWKRLGEDYKLGSPYFTPAAVTFLLSAMAHLNAPLLLTDCAMLDPVGRQTHHREWINTKPWLRLPYPAESAKAYLRSYTREMACKDWEATIALVGSIPVVIGLANCNQIHSELLSFTCLPMNIEKVGSSPCTVVAKDIG